MRPSRIPIFVATLLASLAPGPVAAQVRGELEMERRDRTLSRVELFHGATPVLRVEREIEDDPLLRASARLPASVVGLDGFLSAFLVDRDSTTDLGTAFEIGKGVPMLGGSIEDGAVRYAGAYLKLRWPNLEIAAGGGDRSGDAIGHAGLYVKRSRWSAALGGASGPPGVDFQHFAATWHPVQRGGAPGARLISERRSSDRWLAEVMFTDRANFNHFAVWGQFGMGEFPHRKTFEAVDDISRYVRPPIFLHHYTSGALGMSARYQRTLDVRELTLDARVFPVRALRRGATPNPTVSRGGVGGYFADRVLPSIMVGAFRRTRAGTGSWLGEIGFPPFSVFTEIPMQSGARTYLFVQYRHLGF